MPLLRRGNLGSEHRIIRTVDLAMTQCKQRVFKKTVQVEPRVEGGPGAAPRASARDAGGRRHRGKTVQVARRVLKERDELKLRRVEHAYTSCSKEERKNG